MSLQSALVDQRIARLKNSIITDDPTIVYEKYRDTNATEWKNSTKADEEDIYLNIFSQMRDFKTSATESCYKVQLSNPIHNVVGAQLVGGSIALSINLIDETNQLLSFGIEPFRGVFTAMITPGRYNGKDLAVEITRRMNEAMYMTDILHGTHVIDQKTGLVQEGNKYVNSQMLATFRSSDESIAFQLVTAQLVPEARNFRLYVQDLAPNVIPAVASKDIFTVLGFPRELVKTEGTPIQVLGKDYHYLDNFTRTQHFSTGPSMTVDAQHRYAIYGAQHVDLIGDNIICLDIPEFTENDYVNILTSDDSGINLSQCMGYFPIPVGKNTDTNQHDFSTNWHCLKKVMRQSKTIQFISITLKRLDGRVFDFHGGKHFLMLKLTRRLRQDGDPMAT